VTAGGLVVRNAEVDGNRVDVRVSHEGTVSAVGQVGIAGHDRVIDAHGGALLPGLADRHVHLMAMAAALVSVDCGPPHVTTPHALDTALATAAARTAPHDWVRGVGYHESVAGPVDRARLDVCVSHLPVRVQHRSGALWMLNGAAIRVLGLDEPNALLPPGVERDAAGHPTGRLWRLDTWLRDRLGAPSPPDLGAIGRTLAGYGITRLTDASPDLASGTRARLEQAMVDGHLPQRVTLLGTRTRSPRVDGRLTTGPAKLLPPDHDPWSYDELSTRVVQARGPARLRPVAIHCVSRESLLLTLAVLADIGAVAGDRIEHAAVVPPSVVPEIVRLGLRVVTQPAFVAERGDSYLADVEPDDLACLYPYRSLLRAGVPVVPSSDAPYGTADPWAVLRAARDRRTAAGSVLGPKERVCTRTALSGMLGFPAVRVGVPADLCLLRVPLSEALRRPDAALVRVTLCGGRVAPTTIGPRTA
jgi:predicted amidohydrolase YtcJ